MRRDSLKTSARSPSSPAARAGSATRSPRRWSGPASRVVITGRDRSALGRAPSEQRRRDGCDAARRRAASRTRRRRAIDDSRRAVRRARHPRQQRRHRRRSRNVADMSADEWRRVIDTNLDRRVPLLPRGDSAHAAARRRLDHQHQQPGRQNPFAAGAAYCASKAGLNAFSEALMQEVRYDNIRVSYVMPGSVATGFGGRGESPAATAELEARAGGRRGGRARPDAHTVAQPAEPRRDAAVAAAEEVSTGMIRRSRTTTSSSGSAAARSAMSIARATLASAARSP